MKTFLRLVLIFFGFTVCIACTKQVKEPVTLFNTMEEFTVLADTIITDAVIKNPDDDEWTDYTLRHLDRKVLVNNLFEAVYSKKLVPYDFFNNTELTIDQIKEIESYPDYNRNKIGKVQFEEKWYYDTKSNTMLKKVHSIMLAFELYNSEGDVKGYKPIFKVYLN